MSRPSRHSTATVATTPGGIARSPDEVNREYVDGFVSKSLDRGIILVAELEGLPGLAAEVHAYRSELRIFRHVLGELTVAVHPATQGQGIGPASCSSACSTWWCGNIPTSPGWS